MTARGVGSRGLALGVLALGLVGAALAQEGVWHTMTGPNRSFTADLPVAPKYTEIQLKTGAGSRYSKHQYLVEQDKVAFVVDALVYPADVNISNPQATLQTGLDALAKNLDGGKWTSVDWARHQGFTAADAVGTRQGYEVRSYSVLKARQLFSLTYAGPPGSARSADVNRFIASLKIAP
jgi:hypothetical protein